MIAQPLLDSIPYERARVRTARNARDVRRARGQRMRYRAIGLWVRWLCAATAVVLVYLALLANITRLNYDVSHAKQARARLGLEILRNADVIARLESPEHLEAMAARLGMRDAETFASILLPAPRRIARQADGVALLPGASLTP